MVIPVRYPLRGRTCLHRAIVPRAKPREDSAHGICRRAAREGWGDQRNRSEKAGFFPGHVCSSAGRKSHSAQEAGARVGSGADDAGRGAAQRVGTALRTQPPRPGCSHRGRTRPGVSFRDCLVRGCLDPACFFSGPFSLLLAALGSAGACCYRSPSQKATPPRVAKPTVSHAT